MHLGNELIRLGGDHGARLEQLAAGPIAPLRAVASSEISGLLAFRRILPLVMVRNRINSRVRLNAWRKKRLRLDYFGAGVVAIFTSLSVLLRQRGARPWRMVTNSCLPLCSTTLSIGSADRRFSQIGKDSHTRPVNLIFGASYQFAVTANPVTPNNVVGYYPGNILGALQAVLRYTDPTELNLHCDRQAAHPSFEG
jgi:hypothetical protein